MIAIHRGLETEVFCLDEEITIAQYNKKGDQVFIHINPVHIDQLINALTGAKKSFGEES